MVGLSKPSAFAHSRICSLISNSVGASVGPRPGLPPTRGKELNTGLGEAEADAEADADCRASFCFPFAWPSASLLLPVCFSFACCFSGLCFISAGPLLRLCFGWSSGLLPSCFTGTDAATASCFGFASPVVALLLADHFEFAVGEQVRMIRQGRETAPQVRIPQHGHLLGTDAAQPGQLPDLGRDRPILPFVGQKTHIGTLRFERHALDLGGG